MGGQETYLSEMECGIEIEIDHIDYHNLKNTFTKEIGELRGKINEHELVELAIAALRPYATEN